MARQRRGRSPLAEWVGPHSDEGLMSPKLSEWVTLILSHFLLRKRLGKEEGDLPWLSG